jgi:hypothetical protein
MISICILNWNCLITLEQTIKVIRDDLQNIAYEIIIYDQNSNDGSADYLKKIESNNIQIILDEQNSGNSIARNRMINQSKYKYILLLDSDIVPIKNSICSMINFMENNLQYHYLGYDWNSYTIDEQQATNYEYGIKQSDIIDWKDNIALTQYGIFKRDSLKAFPFPEFYPFNLPGWGGEDNIVGETIKESNTGVGGTIINRVYFHNKGSSIVYLGKDTHQRLYMIRFIYTKYFVDFLTFEEKIHTLKNKTLKKTLLHCQKYHWSINNNLGDIATDYIFKQYFPFFEFDNTEKNNLLMFGGTIIDHIDNANKLHNTKFKNILYFGVGLSNKDELNRAVKNITANNILYTIIPRGPKTKQVLVDNSISCKNPCGDVVQLLASLPLCNTNFDDPELLVYDVYSPNLITPQSNNYETIKVAKNNCFENIKYYNLNNFLVAINNFSKIYSSQVHPFLIASLLGKPCCLYPKDFRAKDFKYFKSFKLDMSKEDSLLLRSEAQQNIQKFIIKFFKEMKKFA